MAQTINLDRLLTLGKEWKTDRHHRIYINDLATLYGLRVTRYNTGNISSASLDGEPISNTKARDLMTTLDLGKFWYDVAEGRFHGKGLSQTMFNTLVEAVYAHLNSEERIVHEDQKH